MKNRHTEASKKIIVQKLEDFLSKLNRNSKILEAMEHEKSPSEQFRKRNQVSIFNDPKPRNIVSSWIEFNFTPELASRIELVDIRPVQMQIIPYILDRKSISCLSETGSGKTLAYVIPYSNLLYNSHHVLLVIIPTKELATQVEDDFRKYSDLAICKVVGGKDIAIQRKELKNARIIVATLGRFKEHLEHMNVDISSIKYLVIDEIDRIMCEDMEDDLMYVYEKLTLIARQVFSATKTFEIGRVGVETEIAFGKINQINSKISLKFTEAVDKERLLAEYCKIYRENSKLMIIFCNKITTCEEIERQFRKFGVRILHGKKDTSYRETVIQDINEQKIRYLVCTDVAGRGVDFKNVDYVINYDFPTTIEKFIHRAGRTGRFSKGECVSFLSKHDIGMYPAIRTLLNKTNIEIPTFLERTSRFIYD